ncbi:MAG: hypothetical protein ACOX0T_01105 [Pelotomaculum sp.]
MITMIFYQDNYVDVIIDFSSSSAVEKYAKAAKYGTRIVSAISNYDRAQLEQLKSLGKKNGGIILTQHHPGDQFF